MSAWPGIAAAGGASAIWAVASTSYTHESRGAGALRVNLMRACVGLPLTLLTVVVLGQISGLWAAVTWRHVGLLLLSVCFSYAFGDTLFLVVARRLGVSTTLAIGSLFPLWSVVVNSVFLHEPLRSGQIAGVVVAVSGVVLVCLVRAREAGEHRRSRDLAGVALALLVSLVMTGNIFFTKKGGEGLPLLAALTVRYLLALPVLSLAIGVWRRLGGPQYRQRPPLRIRAMLPVTVLEAWLGSMLFVYASVQVHLAVSSALFALCPLFSLPVAVAMKEERLSAGRLVAILLTTSGVILLVTA